MQKHVRSWMQRRHAVRPQVTLLIDDGAAQGVGTSHAAARVSRNDAAATPRLPCAEGEQLRGWTLIHVDAAGSEVPPGEVPVLNCVGTRKALHPSPPYV